ncbi:MAG: cob(I)yrinic acid a,c-diamide adenosyltransferase [Bacteroidota bacterium]
MSLKVYTRTGDKGGTSLFGGTKVEKDHIRIEAYGNVDELNSFIGLLRDQENIPSEIADQLFEIQKKLFSIGTILATEKVPKGFNMPVVEPEDSRWLEECIDKFSENLPELKNFILPGGHQVVSLCHVCRTVCRRTERGIVRLNQSKEIDENLLSYINRLSDYFFVLSRALTKHYGAAEVTWQTS